MRRLFLYRGVSYGFAGGLGPWILVFLAGLGVAGPWPAPSASTTTPSVPRGARGWPYAAVLLLRCALLLGWLGAAHAVRSKLRHLAKLL